ncbi:MAG TPA: response regulator [Ktedonobacterales bacterium]|nr:response regulator [Ktedonobacterales bacterium]
MAEQLFEGYMQERQMSVLVVEGNSAARERVRQALGDGYSLRFACGAHEALEAVRQNTPDLVVSEVDLPEGDGLNLCEQVRNLPGASQLPIMLLTSRASITDKVAGFQAGADDYVVKPLDLRLFKARIRLLFRIKGLERPRRDIGA